MGRPQSRCSGLGLSDFIRVPSPAARTTADNLASAGMTLFYQRHGRVCASLVRTQPAVAGSSMAERRPLEPYVGGSSPPPPATQPVTPVSDHGWVTEPEASPDSPDALSLGRGVVVGPGQPAPAPWRDCERRP